MTDATENPSQDAKLVAREAGGTALAAAVGAPLRYISVLLTTRALGAGLFGAYSLALTMANIGAVLGGLGLSPGLLPFLSRARKAQDGASLRGTVRASLLLAAAGGLAAGAALWLAAPWLGVELFHKAQLPRLIRLLAPMAALGALGAVLTALAQGFFAVKERAWLEKVLAVGVTAAGMGAVWRLGWGAEGAAGATLAGGAFLAVSAAWLVFRRVPGAFKRAKASTYQFGNLIGSSWPLMGTSMLSVFLLWTDLLVMGVFRRSHEVGVYSLCVRLAPAVLFAQQSLSPVFMPRLSDLHASGEKEGIRDLYRLTARWAMWPGLVVAGGLLFWGRGILGFFGGEFAEGVAPLAVLALAKGFAVACGMSGSVLAMTGRSRLHLANGLLLLGGNAALNLLWTPAYGGIGAACATCTSIVAVNTLRVAQIWKLYGLLPWNCHSFLPLLGPLAAAAAISRLPAGGLGEWGWLASLGLYGAACAALFFLFGVREEDRVVWRAVKAKLSGGR